jgi:hypothetical protein
MAPGLSNLYIDEVLRAACGPDYRGVFSSDTIPTELRSADRFSFVTNLSRADEEGTHFVAVVARPSHVLYFDPVGLPCIVPSILEFLNGCRRPHLYSSSPFQDPVASSHCGFYCMLYVMFFDSNFAPGFPIRFHDRPPLTRNDPLCERYIVDMLTGWRRRK